MAEALAARLADPATSIDAKLTVLQQLKESLSDVHDTTQLVQVFLPALLSLLRAVPIDLRVTDAPGSKARQLALDVLLCLTRTPSSEPLKVHAQEVVNVCMEAMHDVLENATLAQKVVFEVLKVFKPLLSTYTPSLVDYVCKLYHEFPTASHAAFAGIQTLSSAAAGDDVAAAGPLQPQLSDAAGVLGSLEATTAQASVNTAQASSIRVFKLVQEAPLVAMFVFQMYGEKAGVFQQSMVPFMMEVITASGPAIQLAVPKAMQQTYMDFRAAQIKTMSLLAYILRSQVDLLKPHMLVLAECLMQLLRGCPDTLTTRKELLLLMRHMNLSPLFRDVFRSRLDEVLEQLEGMLGGSANSCPPADVLRPLVHTIQAEHVHYARKSLKPAQLARAVAMLSKIALSRSEASSALSACLRVLINLTEVIYSLAKSTDSEVDGAAKLQGRMLVGCIMQTLVTKLKHISSQGHSLMDDAKAESEALERQKKLLLSTDAAAASSAAGDAQPAANPSAPSSTTGEATAAAAAAAGSETATVSGQKPVVMSFMQLPGEKEKELQDAKSLLAMIINSFKQTLFCISSYAQACQQAAVDAAMAGGHGVMAQMPQGLPIGFTEDEIRTLSKLWTHGLHSLKLLAHADSSQLQGKRVYEAFAEVFMALDSHDFVNVLAARMDELMAAVLEDVDVLFVVAHLLSSQNNNQCCKSFLLLLADFLVNKQLESLRNFHAKEGAATFRLFKMMLVAFGNYPDMEPLLLPHLLRLLDRSLELVATERDPNGFLQLLKLLFKTVTQASPKLQLIHEHILTFLQPCLNRFLAMLNGPNSTELRPILVELCLTLPAQLRSLLPFLSRLMRPLIVALQSSEDMAALGLRTLEMWVDHLNPEFIELAYADVVHELMTALWALLKPGNQLAQKALQLLGKLGGRNRKFLKEPTQLEYRDNPEYGLRMILTLKHQSELLTPLDKCVLLAKQALFNPGVLADAANDAHYRSQALKFLQVCLASFLNLKCPADATEASVDQLLGVVLGQGPVPQLPPLPVKVEQGIRTKMQLLAERDAAIALISAVIAASADEKMPDTAAPFARNVCRHFAMLYAAGTPAPPPAPGMFRHNPNDPQCGAMPQGLRELNISIFLDALLEVLCDKSAARARAALDGLSVFIDALLVLHQEKQKLQLQAAAGSGVGTDQPKPGANLPPVLDELYPRLLHCCCEDTWPSRLAGAAAVKLLTHQLPRGFLIRWAASTVRALFAVIRGLPDHCVFEQGEVDATLTAFLRKSLFDEQLPKHVPKDQVAVGLTIAAQPGHAGEVSQFADEEWVAQVLEILLACILSYSSTSRMRALAEKALNLLANATGRVVSTVVKHRVDTTKDFAQRRITLFKNVEYSISQTDVWTFCLRCSPPVLQLGPDVSTIFQDALLVCREDDSQLQAKVPCLKVASPEAVARLRVASLKLLVAVLSSQDYAQVAEDHRETLVSIFVNNLTVQQHSLQHTCTQISNEIWDLAKQGLKLVSYKQAKPSRDLLNLCLRPVLHNLGFYYTLSPAVLQGIGRLLEGIGDFFNLNLGQKLIDHLRCWLKPEALHKNPVAWKPSEDVFVASLVLDLFHLLPPMASTFLETQIVKDTTQPGLVVLAIELEEKVNSLSLMVPVPHIMTSPYRAPLVRYLNKYPKEAIAYFLEPARISKPSYLSRLLDILRSPEAQPLVAELCASEDKLVRLLSERPSASGNVADVAAQAAFNAVKVLRVLCKLRPDWLPSHPQLFCSLRSLWLAEQNNVGTFVQQQYLKQLAKCILTYLRVQRQDMSPLFELFSLQSSRLSVDFGFLEEFCKSWVPEQLSTDEKRALVKQYLLTSKAAAISSAAATQALQGLVIPLVISSLEKGETGILDAQLVEMIMKDLLDVGGQAECIAVEYLQLATAIFKHVPELVRVDNPTALIKHAWGILKRQDTKDPVTKSYAFLNVAYGIKAFPATPSQIVGQVFYALLRAAQPELKRAVIREAFDVLLPVVCQHCVTYDGKPPAPGASKTPMWMRYLKRVLLDENQSTHNMIHLWQLVLRNADVFFPYRSVIVQQMVSDMHRLGLPNTTTMECRRLALDIAGVLLSWEACRRAASNSSPSPGFKRSREAEASADVEADQCRPFAKAARHDEAACAAAPATDFMQVDVTAGELSAPEIKKQDDSYQLPPVMQDTILQFLTRTVLHLSTGKDDEAITQHSYALALLQRAVKLFPNCNVKIAYIEKYLAQHMAQAMDQAQGAGPGQVGPSIPATPAFLMSSLAVVRVLAEQKSLPMLQACYNQVAALLEPCCMTRNAAAVKDLSAIVKATCSWYLSPEQAGYIESSKILSDIESVLHRFLGAVSSETGLSSNPQLLSSVCCCLAILEALDDTPSGAVIIGNHVPALVTILNRAFREAAHHAQAQQGHQSQQRRQQGATDATEYGSISWTITTCYRLCAPRVLHSNDLKKQVLQSMIGLLVGPHTKGVDPAVFFEMLRIVERWLVRPFPHQTGTLTLKEGILLCQRLCHVERTFDPATRSAWEPVFLALLRQLCNDQQLPQDLRDDAFNKVERLFMVGLRSSTPSTRREFFELYNRQIPETVFERLQFVLHSHDWDGMGNQFWLKFPLEFIFAMLKEDDGVLLATNSAQIPALLPGIKTGRTQEVAAASIKAEEVADHQSPDTLNSVLLPQQQVQTLQARPSAADGTMSTLVRRTVAQQVVDMVEGHVNFLQLTGKWRSRDLVAAMCEYMHADAHVAYHMWVLMFPTLWAALEKHQQVALAKPIIALLSKEYHNRQAHHKPNVIQALLSGITVSQPQPKIPPELIKYLGKTYNAWNIAIPLLEGHVAMFPTDHRCFDSLVDLYKAVNEEDVMYGLWRKRKDVHDVTRTSLLLIQYGHLERAEDLLGDAVRSCHQGAIQASRGEQALWVEQWVHTAKQLAHWDTLLEYARSTDNYELAVDCLWRLADWPHLKELLQTKAQLEESPATLMIRAYTNLQEGDVQTSDKLTQTAMQHAVFRWWQSPDGANACKVPLLQTFQQLVELRESSKILIDLSAGGSRPEHPYNDVKDTAEVWRLRTPNEWESLLHWQDILVWRNQIYNIIIQAFRNMGESAPQLHQLGYRDKAWSVNKLGSMATQHGSPDTALSILNTMYGYNAMDVQEAFVKIKEQAKAYLGRPSELVAGLNLLSTTNLDYFQAHHQSEIYRLKGLFLAQLKDVETAHGAFSTSLSLWRQCSDAWVSWAQTCDDQWEHGLSHQQPNATWLEYMLHCLVQAIKLGSTQAYNLIPRLLYLLTFDNDTGVVGMQLDACGRDVPVNVWLSWIPQLLSSITRSEAKHVKAILMQLALVYPQALYYHLRSFYQVLYASIQRTTSDINKLRAILAAQQARQDAGADGGPSAAAQQAEAGAAQLQALEAMRTAEMQAFEFTREVQEVLRAKHRVVFMVLEAMMSELSARFNTRGAERLLNVMHALLHRCYKMPFANHADVPAPIKVELAQICKAGFNNDSGRHMAHFREEFLQRLDPESPHFPAKLGDLQEQLKLWRNRCQSELDVKMPGPLRLEEESQTLRELPLADIEMPGQYLGGFDPGREVVMLEAFGANVGIVRRPSTSHRRLALLGSDGHTRHMIIQTSVNHYSPQNDERVVQLTRHINRLLDGHAQSRARSLSLHTPVILPLLAQARLLEEDPSSFSYAEAYEGNCARTGREVDVPIVHFKTRCAQPDGSISSSDPQAVEKRLAAFVEICDRVISENVFSQYIYKTILSPDQLWAFKKNFCTQMAVSGLLCQMLLLGGRSPQKLIISKESGRVFHVELTPTYSQQGQLEKADAVPFRLTRNLSTFFTAWGVEGLFVTAMVNAAQAVLPRTNTSNSNMQHVLSLFFRDDISSFFRVRSRLPLKSKTLKQLVDYNTRKTLERVRAVAPHLPPEDHMVNLAHVAQGALELVQAATEPRYLCKCEPTYHPWF